MTRPFPPDKVSIDKEEINGLPLKAYEGKTIIVSHRDILPRLMKEVKVHDVVGFDTETRPAFHKGQRHQVALVQIALPDKVLLVRVNHTGITDEILDFFENQKIVKAGVALHDDIKALQRLKHFEAAGFTDLAMMARQAGLQVEGVKKMAGLLLGFRISKSSQTSNWENPVLTEKQITYAATDAWVCLELYRRLMK